MRQKSVKEAQKRYEQKLKDQGIKNNKTFILKCHVVHDKDIINQLENEENKNGYIKNLIREDMNRS